MVLDKLHLTPLRKVFKRSNVFMKAFVIAFVAIALDYIVHLFYSMPMETAAYFGYKFFVAYLVALFVYDYYSRTVEKMVLAGGLFALVFALVYSDLFLGLLCSIGFCVDISRATEVFGITGFLEVGAIFLVVHVLAFAIGLFTAKKVVK